MGQKLDRFMYDISIIYIALPVFIFLAGWLRLLIAIPVCAVFLISIFLLQKNKPEPVAWRLTRKDTGVIVAVLLILALWVFLSGIGGFSFQNFDFDDRNAIFRDLINKSWPAIYNFPVESTGMIEGIGEIPLQGMLSYYIAFWLPAALFGKLFGWYAANAFLYFWALTGAALVVYYIFRTLRRTSVWSVLILIFFSGLDIVGYILRYKGEIPSIISHIEWWSEYQYSSNTTLLFWVFNQVLVPWLVMLLLLNMKNTKSLFFLYALLFIYGPFPFLGFFPFVLWKAYKGYPVFSGAEKSAGKSTLSKLLYRCLCWFCDGVRRAVSFENLAGGISLLTIFYLYFSNNVASGRYMGLNFIIPAYFPFFVFEVGLYLLLLFVYFRKDPAYWICLISLLLIPLYKVGDYQDFCMRVSIPAIFMIQMMIQKLLLGIPENTILGKIATPTQNVETKAAKTQGSDSCGIPASDRFLSLSGRDQKLIAIILTVMLCVGAVVPVHEIARSIWYTLPEYAPTHAAMTACGEAMADSDTQIISSWGDALIAQSSNGQLWADQKKTLQTIDITTTNYIVTTEDNLFYRYLARRS